MSDRRYREERSSRRSRERLDRSGRDRERDHRDHRDYRDRDQPRKRGGPASRRDAGAAWDDRDSKRKRTADQDGGQFVPATEPQTNGLEDMDVLPPTEEELEETRRVEALFRQAAANHREAKIAGINPVEKVSTRPEPISIEELNKQRGQEDAKPKFLTKEERQRLALERRTTQVKEQQQKNAQVRELLQGTNAIETPSAQGRQQYRERWDRERDPREQDSERRDHDPREQDRERRDRDPRDREGRSDWNRRSRSRERDRGGRDRERTRDGERNRDRRSRSKERDTKEEKQDGDKNFIQTKEDIKAHYLGLKKEKKKVIKPSEKFKFVFSWDASDDTSQDHNPLYNQRIDVRPAFGRGFIAGIDQKLQLKTFEKERDLSRVAKVERRLDESYLGRGDTGRHWSQKERHELTERDWRIFKEDYNISTKGGRVPNPMRNWSESNLPPVLLDAIEKAGYKQPMPIQMQSIPIGLEGRDLIGLAETGSGKTAAFVLPMLVYISKLPPMTAETAVEGPYALIMAPTRELAIQIEREASKFATAMGFRTLAVVGGQSIEEQGFMLRRGCEILIATPGRLVDCLDRRYVVLNQCNYVVLDEADRMVDMGFEVQVTTVLDAMPSSNLKSEDETLAEQQIAALQEDRADQVYRTTVMFSATMPIAVERLARKYLRHPAVIQIGEVGKAAERIEQRVEFVKGDNDKKNKVMNLLYSGIAPPIMIFVNQKRNCDVLSRAINKVGFRSATLHSGKSQEQREEAMESFKAGNIDILVSTDVAGRGIDVKGVTHVINYDMPKSIADYTHRIGRTGRAGMTGVAVSFITNDDSDLFYDLKQMLQATGNPVPPELSHHPASKVKPGAVNQGKRRETVIYAP